MQHLLQQEAVCHMKRLSGRMWASFIVIGFVGQLAWTIENMYFNVFLYNTISTDPNAIATMVAASAAAATITTLLMGALSDRVGRRKPFICAGYIVWGISTAAFGFIRVESVAAWAGAAKAASVAALLVVVMDCVMTFFGSTANDAAFNAYITDSTTPENRGKVESVLATLPLLSMLTIFGGFDWLTQQGEWRAFFLIFGALVVLTGILACFLLKETPQGAPKGNYFAEILYGFRPSVVRSNGALYLALLAFGVFSVAVQVFFPYLIIYMQNYLKLNAYALVLGAVLLAASLISILSGSLIDRYGKLNCVLPAAAGMLAGLGLMYFARSAAFVIGAGIVMMAGYMLVTATLSAVIRDYTPSGQVGLFQGVRMIFAVLLPMLIGPFIGAAVIRNSGVTYLELGVVKNVPTPAIFLAAAAVLLLTAIPVTLLKRRTKA
jgi:MFS family permease